MLKAKKIWFFLNSEDKLQLTFIVFFSIFYVLLEALSISLVIPIVSLVLESSYTSGISFLDKYLFGLFPSFSATYGLVTIFCLILVGVFILKNIFIFYYNYRIFRFIYNFQSNISKKLLNIYLHQPYNFFLQRRSSSIIANINDETNQLSSLVLLPFIYLFSECFLIISFVVLIFIFNLYKIAFILFIFITSSFLLLRVLRKYLKKLGKKRQEETKIKINNMHKLIINIREIILSGKKNYSYSNFSKSVDKIAQMFYKNSSISILPKLFFEVIAILSISALILYFKISNLPTEDIITSLTFFILISFKLLPSLNKITNSLQQLQFSDAVINLVFKELSLNKLTHYSTKKLKLKKQIKFEKVSFKHDKTNEYIFDKTNFVFKKNNIYGIVGKSGVGKTTLIDLLSGLLKPENGRIMVDNKPLIDKKVIRSWQNNISYVSQSINIFNDTLLNNITLNENNKKINSKKLAYILSELELDKIIDKLPKKMETILFENTKNLSGGQIQRIGIARAFYKESDILILDEATNALDQNTEKKVLKFIKKFKNKKTILIISHNKNILNLCNKVIKLKSNTDNKK